MTEAPKVSVEIAEKYAKDVVAGKVLACKRTILACNRHLNDLETADERGLYFDRKAAQIVLNFFLLLKHSKGQWAGAPVVLEPWQQFIIAVVFGWKWKASGLRRFKTVFQFVARKNGKTTQHAGIGLYGLVLDGEMGAEIYSAATKKDQARIMFDEACRMYAQSTSLKRYVKKYKNNLNMPTTNSKFEPLSADANSLDGLNPHMGLIDEIHAHKTREVYEIIDTGTGARQQPLIWSITTAGFNVNGIGYELYDYSCMVLEGTIDDDTHAAFVYELDKEDIENWDDPKLWVKANPNLGVSVKMDDLKAQAKKAKAMPSSKNSFKCKRLNLWVESDDPWMNMEHWRNCQVLDDLDDFDGAVAFGGLDLASVSDIASLVLLLVKDGRIGVFIRNYLPEDAVKKDVQKNAVPYDVWAEQGWLTLTPGNVTDYNFIRKDINDLKDKYDLRSLGVDRWNSTQLVNDLVDDDINIAMFGQGMASMSGPMKQLERLILSGELELLKDPVLEWMARNVVAKKDEADNIKPDRKNSKSKIDGMVALIMAIGRWMADGSDDQSSVYEQRGMITL